MYQLYHHAIIVLIMVGGGGKGIGIILVTFLNLGAVKLTYIVEIAAFSHS